MAAIIRRHPRKLAGGLVLIAASYGIAENILPNPLHTPGVQSVEDRYSSGGGSKNHQPAVSSARANSEAVEGNQDKAKGIGTAHHEEHLQGQKADPSEFDKTWNRTQYGSEKGK